MNENNNLVKTLLEVYKEHTKDITSKPIELSGCTYARAIKNAVGFGPVFPNQKELTHEIDEYIEIDHLLEITKIYAKAIYKLDKCND
jgi:succinyl-diaminopimelate desuccinylase